MAESNEPIAPGKTAKAAAAKAGEAVEETAEVTRSRFARVMNDEEVKALVKPQSLATFGLGAIVSAPLAVGIAGYNVTRAVQHAVERTSDKPVTDKA
jgi:hypothetical protein